MFFKACFSVDQIKAKYRDLAKEHHPDLGGNTATMQDVNREYHEALKGFHGRETWNSTTKKNSKYYYNEQVEQTIMNKINELLGLRMDNVEVSLVGFWIWVEGETKPHREKLGTAGAGCRWHPRRQAWYWQNSKKKSFYNPNVSLNDLKNAYGCRQFEAKEQVN
jgi:hypothetical protein